MVTIHNSAFLRWFQAQHGRRPGPSHMTDADLQDAVTRGAAAQAILNERRLYDARLESALYAWQAKSHGAEGSLADLSEQDSVEQLSRVEGAP